MNNWNCCHNGEEPDWTEFTRLWFGPVRIEADETGETQCYPSHPDQCDFWTLSGEREDGDCEPLHDGDLADLLALLDASGWRKSALQLNLAPFE
jgi:hypothetical protein